MGIFDFLKGGNERVIANDIIRTHRESNENFEAAMKTLNAQVHSLEARIEDTRKGASSTNFYAFGGGTELGFNYAHCGGQILYYGASPSFAEASDIIPHVSGKIAKYLREAGIPEEYITGQNVSLSLRG